MAPKNLKDIVSQWHDAQPHPLAPDLTVGEYTTAAKMATTLKFGSGHAAPDEVVGFWNQFNQMNNMLVTQKKLPYTPEEFMQNAQQVAKVSFAYHGRPPSLPELTRFRDAHPKDVSDYYGSLPDEHYPHVPAAGMVKSLESARPWAQMNLGRDPNKLEASYLHHSGHSPQDYYQQISKQQDQINTTNGQQANTTAGTNGNNNPGR
jgi:hypothetical protein